MERFVFAGELKLPGSLRKRLGQVYGRLIQERDIGKAVGKARRIYAVGDVTVGALLRHGVMPRLSVFDYRVGRRRNADPLIRRTFPDPIKVANESGAISPELWRAIRENIGSGAPQGIYVRGEEDLAAIVCAYFGRPGSIVMYGLPGRGINLLRIDARSKRLAESILRRMASGQD